MCESAAVPEVLALQSAGREQQSLEVGRKLLTAGGEGALVQLSTRLFWSLQLDAQRVRGIAFRWRSDRRCRLPSTHRQG